MDEIKQKDLICIAIILGAFGVAGEVKLKSFTETPENCMSYGPLYDENGQCILTPNSHRIMANHIAVQAPEVKDREAAQALKGTKLYVPRQIFPEPDDEDDFYYSDLIGLEVKTTSGQRMGKIIAIHEFGAGDMLEIQPNPKNGKTPQSLFHPFTKVAVPKIDLTARRVIIEIIDAENGRNPDIT